MTAMFALLTLLDFGGVIADLDFLGTECRVLSAGFLVCRVQ
jgi:hypothetical protein